MEDGHRKKSNVLVKRARTDDDDLAAETVDPNDGPLDTVKRAKIDSNRTTNICQIASKALQSDVIPACYLRPHPKCSLFVAWNGVIVLVFEGFPPAFQKAKDILREHIPLLKDENFGSKWPKTTLGAVNDDAADLSLEDLTNLQSICTKHSSKIATGKFGIEMRSICAVEYSSRGLERCLSRIATPLAIHSGLDIDTTSCPDASSLEPQLEEDRARVDHVVQEWDDLPTYLTKVNTPGSRIGSYREESPSGATCVAFLDALPSQLRSCLDEFVTDIETNFPGRYSWMKPHSLHCTLRSLDLKEEINKETFPQESSADFEDAERTLDKLRQAATKLGLHPDAWVHLDHFHRALQKAKTSTVFHLEGLLDARAKEGKK